jgi:superfamily II DNA or RNA helicase
MGEEFAVGSRVSARGLAWDVLEVAPLGAQTLLRLRCTDGDLGGLEWDILHPAEPVKMERSELRPDVPGSLAAWRLYHQACLLEQVPGPAEILLGTPGRVRIEPYQLVPLMRALELPRPRLLLADGVGLGKTIEAGLIACELIARRRAHRVLIIAPSGPLLVQWAQETRQRFGLRFTTITDAASLQQQRRKLELGGNPFDAIALCMTSLDFAKQEWVLEELERSAWDLAIIDEAHHCISTGGTDREDTQRRRLAEVIARRSDGLLLLTATPHDGYDSHFASLIELLDPSLVNGHGGLTGSAYRRHVVRRLKSQIRDSATGAPLFRERQVIPVKVELDGGLLEPARLFHRALAALVAPRLRRAAQGREHADALAFMSLLKRSVSTIGACVNTLRVVAERYQQAGKVEAEVLRRERARSLRAYRKRLLRFGVLNEGDEGDLAELEAEGMAADLQSFSATELLALTRSDATKEALDALVRLGEAAASDDPKLSAIGREVRAIRAAQPATNVLIYTEYADSQSAALSALRSCGGDVLAISGVDSERERTRTAERFAEEDGIILVSTDSLAEGLNLHQHCFNLIHLDLPYNPNRLEQRNGRIDRYGQERDPQIRYLYLAGTFEERLLLRLIAKYEKARAHLTFMPDTLGVTADEEAWNSSLVAGFAERQAGLFDDEPTAIRTLDREAETANLGAYRDLLREIDRAFNGLDRSVVRHGWRADHAAITDTSQSLAASSVKQRSDVLLGHIDLPDFIAAAITVETGGGPAGRGVLRLPSEWCAGLDDLPGFDRQHSTLRVTRNHARFRDKKGHSLAVLGRAHPMVRRAISSVRRLAGREWDNRVSLALADEGAPLAVLLTYGAEVRSSARVEFGRIFAILLPVSGAAVEIAEPECWLRLAASCRTLARMSIWQDLFACWVPGRRLEAESVADAVMLRETAQVAADHQQRSQRETSDLQDWLHRRASDVCGAFEPQTGDLFGAVAHGPAWQLLPLPLDRLAVFAADDSNTPARRREANSIVELYQRRITEQAARAVLSPPVLRPIGMLMLVPPALRA